MTAEGVLSEFQPQVGLVTGSGLGSVLEQMEVMETLEHAWVEGLPVPRVAGHEGRLVLGRLQGVRVVASFGRVHLYEGWSAGETAAVVRLFGAVGVKMLVLLNAAGSLRPDLGAGSLVVIADHLNLTAASPLEGTACFVDMQEAYSPRLRKILMLKAVEAGIPLTEGVYAAVTGPQYETPAEVRMLRQLGADLVGMSTVPEVIQARALGMEVAAFSIVTNAAAGVARAALSHEEVVARAAEASESVSRLIGLSLREMAG